MNQFTNVHEIHAALKEISFDQVRVIHQMADARNIDPRYMNLDDYRTLILEEAELSVARSDDDEVIRTYSRMLTLIAQRIRKCA